MFRIYNPEFFANIARVKNFDITIIGAGIIGLSTAYQLLKKDPSLKICILEKESGVACHQSGHNSGVIHSGIYYKPGSLKAENCTAGYRMLLDFCDVYEIEYDICGKIILAVEEDELNRLQTLYERGIKNGLKDIKFLSSAEIKDIEPNATGIKGIYVPQTGIVDYKIICKKLSQLLSEKKCDIKFSERVESIEIKSGCVIIKTKQQTINSDFLITCAGLYSDEIALMTNRKIDFRIIPFRGEYYNLTPSARGLVRNLIYPVPDPEFPFLGVHFTRRINGDIEAGPNAVFATKKEGYNKTDLSIRETTRALIYRGFRKMARRYWKTGLMEMQRSFSKKKFVRELQKLVPAVTENDLIKGGAGVRAQACDENGNLLDDFLIIKNENVINVCNAPSPGATSSLSIGKKIADELDI